MAERDAGGKFVKGHKPVGKRSPGRPKRKTEEKYLRWMFARVKKADWDIIVDSTIARAKSGDNVARQWLSDYLIGKPKQPIEVEGITDFNIILAWADGNAEDNLAEAP